LRWYRDGEKESLEPEKLANTGPVSVFDLSQ